MPGRGGAGRGGAGRDGAQRRLRLVSRGCASSLTLRICCIRSVLIATKAFLDPAFHADDYDHDPASHTAALMGADATASIVACAGATRASRQCRAVHTAASDAGRR
jgi:hypothetical protein